MRRVFALIVSACAFASASGVSAHEFWLEPTSHTVEVGRAFGIPIKHGERFAGDRVLRNRASIASFVLMSVGEADGAEGVSHVVGLDGRDVSYARASEAGDHVLSYESVATPHTLSAERFEAYLREEGLTDALALRASRGESKEPGREVYTRCAKSLVRAVRAGGDEASSRQGDAEASGMETSGMKLSGDIVVGLPFELVLGTGVADVADAGGFRVAALLHGEPVEGYELVAAHESDPTTLRRVVTGSDGAAVFAVDRPGRWLVTAIHMERVENDPAVQWHSFWASLTFEVVGDGADVSDGSS